MEHVMLLPNAHRVFYMPVVEPYEVKVSRQNGFPFYYGMTCKEDIDACLKQMRESKETGQQILTKVAAYTAEACD